MTIILVIVNLEKKLSKLEKTKNFSPKTLYVYNIVKKNNILQVIIVFPKLI